MSARSDLPPRPSSARPGRRTGSADRRLRLHRSPTSCRASPRSSAARYSAKSSVAPRMPAGTSTAPAIHARARGECVHDGAPDVVRRRARHRQQRGRHEATRGALGHGDGLAAITQPRADALGGLRQLGRERDHRRRVRAMSNEIGPFSTAVEMLAALDAKQVSSVELVEMHLARIDKLDEALNAIPVRTPERALEAARNADELRAAGESRPTARAADDAQGVDTGRGSAAVGRHHAVQGLPTRRRWTHRSQRVRCGQLPARQDQHPGRARRLAGRQPRLRTIEQPVGPRPHARWQHRRRWGGARRGLHAARDRQRHRRVDPRARGVLRRVRASPLGDRSPAHGVVPARRSAEPGDRDGRAGPARSQRDRPRAALRRRRRTGRARGHRLAARPSRGAP